MKQRIVFLPMLLFIGCASNRGLVERLMRTEPAKFDDIIKNRHRYEVQILYTQIDRDENNRPSFKSFSFNLDSTEYFYPASTVKLPLVLLSFEKLNELKVDGLDMNTTIFHDSCYSGQISARMDSTSESGLPSVSHYSKKILVVSDNDAYNRLYEFMGQKRVNQRMTELGFSDVRIIHRLERPLSRDQNRHTEAVRFLDGEKIIYQQPMLVNELMTVRKPVYKGKGFMRNDSVINKSFDFTYKNFYPLTAQQKLLKRIVFPETTPGEKLFRITEEQRKFVLKYMSQLPGETTFPAYYRDTTYYDAYCKFLMYGSERGKIPDHIRIFNKVGDAYGYLIDNAYIVDFKNNVEFMLSAVINTNVDEIYNDGKYEYEKLGFPFMKDLGTLIYQYELKRTRKHTPDLSEFKFI
jgi:hypothetical protein